MKQLIGIVILSINILAVDLTGTAGALFLRLGVGSRAVSMGEANVAVADNAEGVYWNPAGMYQIDKSQVFLSHSEWYEGIKYENLNYILTTEKNGNIGFGLRFLHMGNITKTEVNANGSPAATLSDGLVIPSSLDVFTARDISFTLSYSNRLAVSTYYGLNAKFISEKISTSSRMGLAVDFGIIHALAKDSWYNTGKISKFVYSILPTTFGLNVQNLGKLGAFDVKADRLPLNFKVGVGYTFRPGNGNYGINFVMDVNQSLDNNSQFNTGLELVIHNIIALRMGYRTGEEGGLINGVTGGFGLKWRDYTLDYSLMNIHDVFGLTHQVSVHINFGNNISEELVKQIQSLDQQAQQSMGLSQDSIKKMLSAEKEKQITSSQTVQTTIKSTNQPIVETTQNKPSKVEDLVPQHNEAENASAPQEEETITNTTQEIPQTSSTPAEDNTEVIPTSVAQPSQQEQPSPASAPAPEQPTPATTPAPAQNNAADFETIVSDGDNLFEQGDYTNAIEKYKKAVAIKDNPELHQKMGDAYLRNGNIEMAADEFTKASQ